MKYVFFIFMKEKMWRNYKGFFFLMIVCYMYSLEYGEVLCFFYILGIFSGYDGNFEESVD